MIDSAGFSFPFHIDPATGGVSKARGSDKIRANLLALLQTDPGERVLRRTYGGGLRGLVHEPVGSAFHALLRGQIARAVAHHEPRIELLALDVRAGDAPGSTNVELIYDVRGTRERARLVVTLGAS